MQTSERFGFVLPSRDAPDDIADINQISDNFRIIDNKMVEREEGKGLSENDYTTQEKRKLEKLSENSISATANDGDKEYYSVFNAQPTNAYIYSHEVGDTLNATEFRVEKDKISLVGIVDGQENNPVAMRGIKTPDGTDPTQAVNVAYIDNLPKDLSNVAPAIPNSKSGTAVALTDISPFEQTIKIKATSDTVDVSTAKVQRYGGNLISSISQHANANITDGVITQINADTRANLLFKVVATTNGVVETPATLVANEIGRHSMSFTIKDGLTQLVFGLGGTQRDTTVLLNTVPSGTYTISWKLTNATQGSISWRDMQIEPGTPVIPTPYEPYTEPTTYDINADGTVEGVTPLYPTTTLMSDTEGVVLDVNYNADTKKYIDNKIAEVVALALEV